MRAQAGNSEATRTTTSRLFTLKPWKHPVATVASRASQNNDNNKTSSLNDYNMVLGGFRVCDAIRIIISKATTKLRNSTEKSTTTVNSLTTKHASTCMSPPPRPLPLPLLPLQPPPIMNVNMKMQMMMVMMMMTIMRMTWVVMVRMP